MPRTSPYAAEALAVRNSSGINKPEDLIGNTIATLFVSTSQYSLLGVFSAFPDAKAQQSTTLLDGGTAKAIGETAKFLKEQGKVEAVLPDYSPHVSAKFVAE
jgi:ABC-type taurine transport system substrate-binding protein